MSMVFDTKIAVVLREDVAVWQKLNMTAFLVSGISGTDASTVGENYEDGSGNLYLPMFRQPVMVFAADADQIRKVYERAMRREIRLAIFTEELFSTGNDIDNRAAVIAVAADALKLVGLAMRDHKKVVDKVLKGLSLHT